MPSKRQPDYWLRSCCSSFTYEEFISAQEKFQKAQAEQLAVRNEEVATAIEDVISLVEVRRSVLFSSYVCASTCCDSY